MIKPKILNIPPKIYLQVGDIWENTDFNELEDTDEVTWCKERINTNDIVYYRRSKKKVNKSNK